MNMFVIIQHLILSQNFTKDKIRKKDDTRNMKYGENNPFVDI